MVRRRLLPVLLIAVGLTLASCGLFSSDRPKIPCPHVLILDDAGHLVRFRPGPGRDITDIQFQARIANFVGSCDYDDNGVNIDLQVMIAVERGAASRDGDVSFKYFVAIPEFLPQPEGKRILPVKGKFEENQSRLVYQDEVSLFIPLDKATNGPAKEVVLGFQLTPDELKYNRSNRR